MFVSPSFSSPGFLKPWSSFSIFRPTFRGFLHRTICGGSLSDDVWEVGSGCLGPPRGDAWLPAIEQGAIWSYPEVSNQHGSCIVNNKQYEKRRMGGGVAGIIFVHYLEMKRLGGYSLVLPNCPPPRNSHSQDYFICSRESLHLWLLLGGGSDG